MSLSIITVQLAVVSPLPLLHGKMRVVSLRDSAFQGQGLYDLFSRKKKKKKDFQQF